MPSRWSGQGWRAGVAALLGVATPLLLSAQPQPSAYAGTTTCATCHGDVAASFRRNPHWALELGLKGRGEWKDRVCEACHGPGAKHAESLEAAAIWQPDKLPARRAEEICLACHRGDQTHLGRIHGSHARGQVPCTDCHTIHGSRTESPAPRRPADVTAMCGQCHAAVVAEFARPHSHRLREGAISCVDCHNPHGELLAADQRLAMANEPGCVRCHGDKRGPFVFEHAPVRLEGCTSCHEPHGSVNPRMLTRSEVSVLCTQCHSTITTRATAAAALGGIPPAFHDLRSARFRNCTLCHQKIHGSQVNPDFLR